MSSSVTAHGAAVRAGRAQAAATPLSFPAGGSCGSSASFTGLTPARLLDTRTGTGFDTIDHLFSGGGAVAGGTSMDLPVIGRGGVPSSGATAVALNVTATNPSAASYITVYPAGQVRPLASNLNMVAGQTIPNMVIVPLGADGKVTIFDNAGTTDIVVDVLGWWPSTAFNGLTPARLIDTRAEPGADTIDHRFVAIGQVGGAASIDLHVAGRGGVPATGAGAVAVNITVSNPTAASYVTAYPTGQPRPTASNLNMVPGETIPNMAIVPLGSDGSITLYNNAGSTDLIVDVLGWFPTGATFTGLTPTRLLDTRRGFVTIDHQAEGLGSIAGQSTLDLTVAGRGGVPADAGAVALNLTATGATTDTYLTAYPTGRPRPLASNLNVSSGSTIPDMVLVPLGAGGKITLFDNAGTTDVIVDVLGWFPSAPRIADVAGLDPRSYASEATISADGRFVAFASYYPPGVTAENKNVYVTDRIACTTTRVDYSTAGVPGYDFAEEPHISANGRFIVYRSASDNLVSTSSPSSTGGLYQTYLLDRASGPFGTTTLVSQSSTGQAGSSLSSGGSVDDSGRYVVFGSVDAVNLIPGDSNGHSSGNFLRDTVSGTTTALAIGLNGARANAPAYHGTISPDGRYVSFLSAASNLVVSDTNGTYDHFVRDLRDGTTTRIDVASDGTQANAADISEGGNIVSPDGHLVAFTSTASNLVSGDTNGLPDVFLHDMRTGTTVRVDLGADGAQSSGAATGPFPHDQATVTGMSDDGRYISFDSTATNLIPNDTNNAQDVFVRDTVAGTTRRLDLAPDGSQITPGPNDGFDSVDMTADGAAVLILATTTALVPDSSADVARVYLASTAPR